MLTLEKTERIRNNLRRFTDGLPENVQNRELLITAFDDLVDEVGFIEREKASNSDIRLLIVEMREGFRRMDERFEAVDKRFSSIQWLTGLMFTVLALMLTWFGSIKPSMDEETKAIKLEKLIERSVDQGVQRGIQPEPAQNPR